MRGLVLQLFSKLEAALASFHHQGGEIQNALSGVLGANAASMNIRNKVSVGVSVGSFRPVCHVSGEALGSCQARPLSNQKDDDCGLQQLAELVENAYAAVVNCRYRTDAPASSLRARAKERQQSRDLLPDGGYRKPITDSDLQILFGNASVDEILAGRFTQLTTQVRAQEIFVFAGCPRKDFEQIPLAQEILAEIRDQI